ncbi:hypothetical protein CEXT_63811 [Caerostris extrusa]|uniref:Ycf15 n=1 Tax=Caerostris extrusa TaxID=172846 RepID=A0AAV4P6X2_CAEEX|nr:hypothetical protein CEXT_63811 [Caerostris extrusa]
MGGVRLLLSFHSRPLTNYWTFNSGANAEAGGINGIRPPRAEHRSQRITKSLIECRHFDKPDLHGNSSAIYGSNVWYKFRFSLIVSK